MYLINFFLNFQQKQLKRRFPNLNPFRKDDRMIPKFTGETDSPAVVDMC